MIKDLEEKVLELVRLLVSQGCNQMIEQEDQK
jgi:hypothetical protein